MGYTMAEKILAAHTRQKGVKAGDFIWAKVDLMLGNDITAPLAIRQFEKFSHKRLADPNKIVLVPDHFTPNKDIKSAQQCKLLREFARENKIRHYYEVGRVGIEHALLPELGLVCPGDLVIGADSHTCTYGALGAFATGVGSTDLAVAWRTGHVWLKVPETIKFVYNGTLPKWVSGKDLILYTIGDIGVDGALYRVMEFSGEVIDKLPMDGRLTMANMAIEAGGKAGLFAPDKITWNYIKKVNPRRYPKVYRKWKELRSDEDANYVEVREYDVSKWEPAVALPHLPSNVRPVSKVKNVKIDQVVIGSCTNGRLSDLQVAADILRGRKVHPDVRLIIIPGTQQIYLEAVRRKWAEIFVKAGAVFSPPTCGPCLGGHMGVLADGEVCLATTNRNFVGRMGSLKSFVYLSNPAVAAASAIKGKIVHPEEVV